MRSTLEKLSRNSDTTVAMHYALNLSLALLCYCDDGIIKIDDSAAERALRAVAIGLCKYLFVDANSDGERNAPIYSLIGMAKVNGVVLETWLRHVLTNIDKHPINRVDDLLHRRRAELHLPAKCGCRPAQLPFRAQTQHRRISTVSTRSDSRFRS